MLCQRPPELPKERAGRRVGRRRARRTSKILRMKWRRADGQQNEQDGGDRARRMDKLHDLLPLRAASSPREHPIYLAPLMARQLAFVNSRKHH